MKSLSVLIFIKAISSLMKTSYYMESMATFTFIKVLFVAAVLGAIFGVRLVELYFDL